MADHSDVDYFKEALSSIDLVQRLASHQVQLNQFQCQYLSSKLGETRSFLKAASDVLAAVCDPDDIRRKALLMLHFVVKRAEKLVRDCCCEMDSWLESAVTLAQVKEDIMDILLDLRWWTSMVAIAIASVTCMIEQQIELELLRFAEEDFESLLKQLQLASNELHAAVTKDEDQLRKRLRDVQASLDGRNRDPQQNHEYLLAAHVRSRLEDTVFETPADADLNVYDDSRMIGMGGFGVVFNVRWLGRRCALKLLKFGGGGRKEATSLSALQHPNIVQFYRYWEAPYDTAPHGTQSAAFSGAPRSDTSMSSYALKEINSHILMELLPSDLAQYMQALKVKVGCKQRSQPSPGLLMSVDVAIDVMLQIAKAMWHLNNNDVAHRDLKPNNVLVRPVSDDEVPELSTQGYLRVKLGDFGLAKTKVRSSGSSAQTMNVGTKLYGAPEVFSKETFSEKKFPRQADVWSFGIMFNEVLSGKPPFERRGSRPGISELRGVIRKGLRPALPENCPDYLKFCITNCWELRPRDRPNFSDLWKMLRSAQVRSLGIIRENHDLFTYKTRGHDVKRLHPLKRTPVPASAPVLKNNASVKSNSFWGKLLRRITSLPVRSTNYESEPSTGLFDEGKPRRHWSRLKDDGSSKISQHISGLDLFSETVSGFGEGSRSLLPGDEKALSITQGILPVESSVSVTSTKWQKVTFLGSGTFGNMYMGFNNNNGAFCAMKEVLLISDDHKSRESVKQLEQDISLLSKLRHENIVHYIGTETFDDRLYIYLEYISGGSIHRLLQECGAFQEPIVRNYTRQILSGLAYLHNQNTVHRNIKGANILVDTNGLVKLADFGMEKHISARAFLKSFKRTPYWMAPEVINNTGGYDLAADIWSLGCTVLEMVTPKSPRRQREGLSAMFQIGNSKEMPTIPETLSRDGKDFVWCCLQQDPAHRPTAALLLEHPFVQDGALARADLLPGTISAGELVTLSLNSGHRPAPVHEKEGEEPNELDLDSYLQTKGQMSPAPLGGGFGSSILRPNSGSAAFSAYPNKGCDFSVKSTSGDSNELDLYRSLQTKEQKDTQPNQDFATVSFSTGPYPIPHSQPSTTAAGRSMCTPVGSTMEQDGSFEPGSRGGLSSHEPISESNDRDPPNYMSFSDFLLLLCIFLEPLSNIWMCLTDQGRLLIGSFILWFQSHIFERYIEQVPSRYKWRVNSRYLKTNRFLGQGCSGIIYETTWSGRENLCLLARKDFPAVERDVFENEAARLVELGDHPNIVKSLCWTIDKRSCSLVMEYMRYDLYSVVQKRKGEQRKVDASAYIVSPKHLVKGISPPFELLTSVDLILQIATGMMYLHSRGIAHGDLKPTNVLVSSETSPILVKVVDFGLNNTKRRSTTLVSFRARCLQIVKWKAPELFEGYLDSLVVDSDNLWAGSHIESDIAQMLNDSNSGVFSSAGKRRADIYSFALTCSHILGVQNWDTKMNWIELRKLILGGLRPQLPSGCPRILVSLISSCWDADPLRRPTFIEICKQSQVVNKRTFASW